MTTGCPGCRSLLVGTEEQERDFIYLRCQNWPNSPISSPVGSGYLSAICQADLRPWILSQESHDNMNNWNIIIFHPFSLSLSVVATIAPYGLLQKIQLLPADTTPSCCKMIMGNTGVDIEMELIGDDERIAWRDMLRTDEYITETHSTSAVLGAGGPTESSLTGSAEQQLRSVRTEFVKRVSGPVLNELLDVLLQHTVINQEEMESVKVIAERTEKARDIIDMMLRKGNESCSRMINLLGELDQCLCSLLQINSVGVPT
eukprot:XP_014041698.1 PREDICTED: uncharacterized protein LOC106594836 [Salmo salar]